MVRFGFGKKGDDGDRRNSSQSAQSENPYAQQEANDPYADSAKYANMTPYHQARAGLTTGLQHTPSSNGQGGRPTGRYDSGNSNQVSHNTHGALSSTGYGADRYGSAGGYGSDRYNSPAGGDRGPGGNGGFGQSNNERDGNREAPFAGTPSHQPLDQQPPPLSGATSYGQSVTESNTYGGGYGEQRELTAEEQEEAEYQSILAQKRQIQQESVSSVNRSVQTARRANELGQATLARLGVQGERLQNTERNLDLAATQNKVAQDRAAELKTLNRSMFAVHVGNPFTSKQRQQRADEEVLNRHRAERDQKEATRREGYAANQRMESAFKEINAAESRARPQTRKKDYGKFVLDEEDEESRLQGMRAEDEIEDRLGELGQEVSNMNLIGRAIGREVEAQNKQIDRIMSKSDAVDDATRMNRERLARIK
ncbi:Target SNARE coiled-coil domain protein [Metarhizium album ARSEF 1941]|uniref:Target SNARE coiled-coil domain protein n=1 Tax=Metarhizium album (strain ARSEF 1941) TaxID=1081103 RepID=A0A0B2WYT0_METAS|nr:Target SNARE coiled-coil domain protein [Metarhizium album ARSEF 1941]KHN98582.1 Target SNARE coiled-coil domain protein [Metarhizium album ARSEF 1941]